MRFAEEQRKMRMQHHIAIQDEYSQPIVYAAMPEIISYRNEMARPADAKIGLFVISVEA